VVVSNVLKQELIDRGIDAGKILVNPNGVDTERNHPGVDASALRLKLGLDSKIVFGFIGTFGPWHGAEVLAAAFCELIRRSPELRENAALLLIGDGERYDAVRALVHDAGCESSVRFIGRVAQEEAREYLAACDIFTSPHVPNPDGTPFFGSPTKLFEYMAMGRPIIASRLFQIEEIIHNGKNGVLVAPGDVEGWANAMQALAQDREAWRRLGSQARRDAVERHSWKIHAENIFAKMAERSLLLPSPSFIPSPVTR
jgi:glycosyltransferase involved in cell wall biosynthesis